MIGIIRNYLFPKKATDSVLKIPEVLVQAFGLPTIIKNCQKTDFEKLILAIDPNLRELPDPFKYLNAYEALIRKAKNPLNHLDAADYELFKHLQKAKILFVRADELLNKNLLADAANFYSKRLLIYPFHSYARVNIGYIFRTTGKLDLSEQHYLEGINHFPQSAFLHSNIGKLQSGQEAIDSFEKAFQLGDCCMGNISLFYDALEKQNGNEHAQQALLNGFEKYGSFEFINFLAHKKFDRGSDEFVSFIMIMIDKIKDPYQKNREQGLLAGLLAEEGHTKAALIILQGLINSDTPEIGIHWNYLLCLKELQQIDKMTETLNNLLAQKWLTDLDRVFLNERLEALELQPTYF